MKIFKKADFYEVKSFSKSTITCLFKDSIIKNQYPQRGTI